MTSSPGVRVAETPMPQRPVYVMRSIDVHLYDALAKGRFAFVTGPPQSGKSLLLRHTADRLREEGVRCVEIYPRMLGGVEPSGTTWFYGLVETMVSQLGLGDPLLIWKKSEGLPPIRRWVHFLREEVRPNIEEPVTLFFDDLDAIDDLPVPRSDLLRSMHPPKGDARRATDRTPLTFCLLGTHRPEGLEGEAARLFLRADEFRIEDFTRSDAQALLPGLQGLGHDASALLSAVLDWTHGHPALTMRLCKALVEKPLIPDEDVHAGVDRLVKTAILSDPQRISALAEAERRIRRDATGEQVRLWGRLLAGELVDADPDDAAQRALRASGFAVIQGSKLRPRNRMFTAVFGADWVEARAKEQGLAARVTAWLDARRDPALLLRGEALEEAERWMRGRDEVAVAERDFLTASLVQRNQQLIATHRKQLTWLHGRARQWIYGLLAATVVLVGMLAIANIWQHREIRALETEIVEVRQAHDAVMAAGGGVASERSRGQRDAIKGLSEAMRALALDSGAQDRLDKLAGLADQASVSGDARDLLRELRGVKAWLRRDESRFVEPHIARVDALEAELAKLKGEQPAPTLTPKSAVVAVAGADEDAPPPEPVARPTPKPKAKPSPAQPSADRPAPAKPKPRPRVEKPSPTAGLKKRVARQAGFYKRSVLRCRNGNDQKVGIRLTVQPDGRVSAAQVTRGAANGSQASCVEGAVKSFRFAPFEGAPLSVDIEYDL